MSLSTSRWSLSGAPDRAIMMRLLQKAIAGGMYAFEPEKCKRANLTAIAMSILKILSYGYNLATIKS